MLTLRYNLLLASTAFKQFITLSPLVMAAILSLFKRQAQSKDNDFIFPVPSGENGPNNSVFTLGSTLKLEWATTYKKSDLFLYQQLARASSCGNCVNGPYNIASESFSSHIYTRLLTGSR